MTSRQGESPRVIRILDPQVAAQIAAGEVIIRPAAVVKELVENALDAGARTIAVEIAEGGRRRIRVVDDGGGMSREEAPLSLQRHATSKLRREEELLHITTLGFRGEALPSIAAVSRLTLCTCLPGEPVGVRLVVVAGELQESSPWAGTPGTQVEVEELFFNTPARRKFLKSKDAEQAYILETLRALSLGYPEVHFSLQTPAKTLLTAPAVRHLTDRVAVLHGTDLAAALLPLALGHGPWQVTGLITHPDFSLATNRVQVFLVNRRVVQDRILGAVLKEAYQGLLPRGRHPGTVIHLSLPPDAVDVNVHPTKAEVRFQEPGRVYALLLSALRQGLGPLSGPQPAYTVSWQPEGVPRAGEMTPAPLWPPAPWPTSSPVPPGQAAVAPGWAPAYAPRSFRFQDLTVIGQLHHTYILAQGADGLIIIDQHAAHERVLYEELKSRGPEAARQALLFPRVVEVAPAQADWVREHLEDLARAGLELSPFGGASFLITAAPACLAQADLAAVVAEAVEALAPLKSLTNPQLVQEHALLSLACRGAIKAGEPLNGEKIQALLQKLDELPVSSHCPHGRPLWRLISYDELHHSFRRGRE